MAKLKTLAFDFGASSGRAMLGEFDGRAISLGELHRFSNDPVLAGGRLYWDILRLFHEVKAGLFAAAAGGEISSIGVDTWGVDFGLLDEGGELLGNPVHYRDARTEGYLEKAEELFGREYIFSETGIQFLWFNTIYQLMAIKEQNPSRLEAAKTLLFIPDLFNYFLTGVKATEYTAATTSQLYNPVKSDWSLGLIDKIGLPREMFLPARAPGQILAPLSKALRDEVNMGEVPVSLVASHDTGSAVVSAPAKEGEDYLYISCGTWSLLGIETTEPILSERAMELSFTNEGGACGTIRFLKNIMGLWIEQECRNQWIREGERLSFEELEAAARKSGEFTAFIDPDDLTFAAPGDMPKRIREFCARTNQRVPETKGEIVRIIIESLALKYRRTLELLEDIIGKRLDIVHILGGGVQDSLLCQFTANATKRPVIAGPVEATSMGNIGVQLMALGEVSSLAEVRGIISNSFEPKEYPPQDGEAWDAAYERFLKIL